MYTKSATTYSDPYKVLIDQEKSVISTSLPTTGSVVEADAPADDLRITGRLAVWGNGRMACRIDGSDYAHYKTKLIKLRYSNDDQIAVMLNGDPDELQRMQLWRQWAADIAHRITALLHP